MANDNQNDSFYKKKIKKLTEENEKLKLEVEALKREIENSNGKKPIHNSSDSVKRDFEKQALNNSLFSKKNYTLYLLGLIYNTSFFNIYKNIIKFFKKYALVSTTIKIVTSIITFLETGTVFVLVSSIFLVSLPFTLIIGYAALMVNIFKGKKLKKKINSMTKDKRVATFFPPRGDALEEDSFFAGMVREWRDRNDGVAIIVSPYFFSTKGISKSKKVFLTLRDEEKNVVIIRRHYFFILKRKTFKNMGKDITMVY